MINLVGIFILLILNAIFAMGEIAMVSCRKTRLEDRARQGNPGAKAALILLNHPDRLLSTVQIGITSVSTLAGAFGGIEIASHLTHWFILHHVGPSIAHATAMFLVVGAITFLSLIFGELIPKSIALNDPESVAIIAAPLLVGIATITHPLIRLLTWITSSFLRVFGLSNARSAPVSEEEFQLLIDEGVHHGVIEREESDIIKSVFRFDDQKASDVMIHRQQISWINLMDPSDTIRAHIIDAEFTKFMVCDGELDNVQGVLFVKDYIKALGTDPFPDIAHLITPPLFIPETMSGLKILEKFRQEKCYVGIVLNEYGAVEGWVTLHDLIESLVGDLPDSDDPNSETILKQPDGSWLIDGSTLLTELNDRLDLDIDRADRGYSTVSGLMMDRLNKIPKVGDFFMDWGYRFEVIDMDGHRVDKVVIAAVLAKNKETA